MHKQKRNTTRKRKGGKRRQKIARGTWTQLRNEGKIIRAEYIIEKYKDKIPRGIQAKLIGTQNEEEKNSLKIIVANILTKINNDYARDEAFEALNSLLKNPNFKLEWLTPDLGEKISSIANTIIKNTSGESTKEGFIAINYLLKNPNFNPQLLDTIKTIAENTSRNSTWKAFEALNSFLEKQNFKPEWLHQYSNPIFNTIIKNTSEESTKEGFIAINSLLENPNFKQEWLTKELGEKISSIANTIIRNTSEYSTWEAFKALDSLLENPNFTSKFIPLIEIMIKGKKGPEIQKTLEKFNEIIKEEKSIVLLQ
ncbi:MAG: hypothetical protein QXP22_03720, partial [Candidatus Anstonellales archaeon]